MVLKPGDPFMGLLRRSFRQKGSIFTILSHQRGAKIAAD